MTNQQGSTSCYTPIKYKNSKGEDKKGTLNGSQHYYKDTKINIYYDSSSDSVVTSRFTLYLGIGLIVFSIILGSSAVYQYIMTTRSSAYNSAQGASLIKNTIMGK